MELMPCNQWRTVVVSVCPSFLAPWWDNPKKYSTQKRSFNCGGHPHHQLEPGVSLTAALLVLPAEGGASANRSGWMLSAEVPEGHALSFGFSDLAQTAGHWGGKVRLISSRCWMPRVGDSACSTSETFTGGTGDWTVALTQQAARCRTLCPSGPQSSMTGTA